MPVCNSDNIDAAWQMPLMPPKATNAVARRYCHITDRFVPVIAWIPFVISKNPVKQQEIIGYPMGICCIMSAAIEKNII